MENTIQNSGAVATQTITFSDTQEKAARTKEPPLLPKKQVKDFGYDYGQMLLMDREQLFEKIVAHEQLDTQIRYFALYALMFSAIYGVFLGGYAGGFQILADAIKIPILLFGTLCLCLPALYIFNVLLGSKLTFRQTLVMLLVSTYLMSALLAALAPILFFFIMTTTGSEFISLLNIVTCTISGGFAVDMLLKGMRYITVKQGYSSSIRVVKVWAVIYAIVGSQLSWGLRPFIGESGNFILFRSVEGNFFEFAFKLVSSLLLQLFSV